VAGAPQGPYAWSGHHLLDGDTEGRRYGGRLVQVDGTEDWRLLSWIHHDGDGRFVGAVSDPVPVCIAENRLLVELT